MSSVTPTTATSLPAVRVAPRRPRSTMPVSFVVAIVLHVAVGAMLYYFVTEPVVPSVDVKQVSESRIHFVDRQVAPPEQIVPEELQPMEYLPVNDVVAEAIPEEPLVIETLPDVPMHIDPVEPVQEIISPPIRVNPRKARRPIQKRAARSKLRVANRPNVEKYYPWDARANGIEGTTIIRITVEPTGVVSDAIVATSSGYRILDEAALRVAYMYRFGSGISGTANLPVRFRLR